MKRLFSKFDFWAGIVAFGMTIINLIVYTILATQDYVEMRYLSFIFLVGYMICAWIPFFLTLFFRIQFNRIIIVAYQMFLFLSMILGSLWRFYVLWDPYDQIMHFASGILIALIAYNFFKNSKKNDISLVWIFVLTFSISLMCGGIWEIYEFVSDGLLGNNAQGTLGLYGRDAIMDTMYDLICDFVGGIIGGVACVVLEWKNKRNSNQTTNR